MVEDQVGQTISAVLDQASERTPCEVYQNYRLEEVQLFRVIPLF